MPTKEKPKKMVDKCLLIKTPDQRCFFTEEKNFPLLVEFSRTFDAEISVVKTHKQVQALDLSDLAKMICSPKEDQYPTYDILEVKLAPVVNASRNKFTEKIQKIKEVSESIKALILKGHLVTLDDIEDEYPDFSRSTLNHYLSRARRELQAAGHVIKKMKPGQYVLVPN